ncbi:MAG: DUF4349 domain-containing protein [Candidatus Magasanikbacteria bacterium]
MSKSLKISLVVGGIIVVLGSVVTALYFSNNRTGYALDADYSYNMAEEAVYPGEGSFGLAMDDAVPSPSAAMGKRVTAQSANTGGASAPVKPEAQQERLVIKTGSMSMVVENVRAGVKAIGDYAVQKGGFIVYSNIYKSGIAPYGEITVRIPAKDFDQGIEDVKAMGEVTSQSVNGQDVTEEYVDLDAQLVNLRAGEQQFLEIMKKAVKIEDILAVQTQLTYIRGQIESIQGRMKYLRQSADLSTLTVHLSTDPDVLPSVDTEDQWKPWGAVKNSFRQLVDLGKGLIDVLIWLVVFVPLWFVISLAVWGVVRLVKRLSRGKNIQ